MKRTSLIGLRISNELLDEFEEFVGTGKKYQNLSVCIRDLAKLGLQVIRYQELIKDPKCADDFARKMGELIEKENMEEWTQTLTTEQLDGAVMFLRLEKERRYDQKSLR